MYFASIQQEIKQKTFWGCSLELIEKNMKDTLLSYVILIVFSSPVGSLCHTRGVARRPSFVVRRVSSVSTITTRNNSDIKSIFGANVQHVPGLCLLGIGGAPYISHKIMAQKPNFHIFDFFSETTGRWCFILC